MSGDRVGAMTTDEFRGEPEPVFLRGEWVERVEKRNDFALLVGRNRQTVMLDRGAIERACLALGLELKR